MMQAPATPRRTPDDLELSERHVISVLLQRHEDEYGHCRLERLWKQHGDPLMKAKVDWIYTLIAN
jgi:hypothetical protein